MQEPIVYYRSRHPYPHEFSTRIKQGDRMLSRLQHALLVLASYQRKSKQRYHHTHWRVSRPRLLQAANDTLHRFFKALAVGMPRIVEDDAKFEHYLKLVFIQDNVVERFANTAVVEISYDYGDLRDLYMMVRDETRKLIAQQARMGIRAVNE